jgi:5-carboxymethyl-2-hydroxymuconate isomerase
VPHLTVELSGNLADRSAPMARALHAALMASGLFEPGAPRVRCLVAAASAIADLHPDNAFADAVLRLGQGRSVAERRRLGAALIDAMAEVLADRMDAGHTALSVEVVEIGMGWKRNTIHARLKGA